MRPRNSIEAMAAPGELWEFIIPSSIYLMLSADYWSPAFTTMGTPYQSLRLSTHFLDPLLQS
jgi:hypothetical protein